MSVVSQPWPPRRAGTCSGRAQNRGRSFTNLAGPCHARDPPPSGNARGQRRPKPSTERTLGENLVPPGPCAKWFFGRRPGTGPSGPVRCQEQRPVHTAEVGTAAERPEADRPAPTPRRPDAAPAPARPPPGPPARADAALRQQRPIGVQPVGAAVQRRARLVPRHLRRQARDRPGFDIGRVGQHEVEPTAAERGAPGADNEPGPRRRARAPPRSAAPVPPRPAPGRRRRPWRAGIRTGRRAAGSRCRCRGRARAAPPPARGKAASAASISVSESARGISVAGDTSKGSDQNSAAPRRCATGSRSSRRRSSAAKRSAASGGTGRADRAAGPPCGTPWRGRAAAALPARGVSNAAARRRWPARHSRAPTVWPGPRDGRRWRPPAWRRAAITPPRPPRAWPPAPPR